MNEQGHYTPYHPKWYRHPVSVWWWLKTWSYTRFVLRELTSVAVVFFAVVTLWQIHSVVKGPQAYAHFLARLKTPLFLVLDVLAFLFVLFHSVTWFNLAPKAMVVRLGGKRVPDFVVAGLNYFAWVVISGAVAWILLRGRL